MRHKSLRLLTVLVLLALAPAAAAAPAQASPVAQVERPFGLPFADPAGPSTWILGQLYGNTTGAYRNRNTTYSAGQGLHFGVDLGAPCRTLIVAVADGIVAKVDPPEHRALPHSLMIDHANGYASFYGHLYERPNLVRGQAVKRGEVVAMVGDPDATCYSRPHLHLEIRDAGVYRHTYNPIQFIEADWDSLVLASGTGFERDLNDPRRWQYIEDQPEEIQMGGPLLNNYGDVWPLNWGGNR